MKNELLLRQIDYWLTMARFYSVRAQENEGIERLFNDAESRAWHLIQELEKEISIEVKS